MKRHSILPTFILLFTLTAFSQNPFAKYGFDIPVATSSKGEFEEFHDLTRMVEIGSVIYDTKIKKITGFVEQEKREKEVSPVTTAMSIDPLCEKYYWISPYAFCLNNPVRFVDPDGRDVWEINGEGHIIWKEESDTHRLYSLNEDGSRSDNFIEVQNRDILDQLTFDRPDHQGKDFKGNYSETNNNGTEALGVFEFASKNSNVEWGFDGYEGNTYVVRTSHLEGKAHPVDKGKTQVFSVHSHPSVDGTKGPSGMDQHNQHYNNSPRNSFIYHPATNTYYKYSSRTVDPNNPSWNGVHQTQQIPRPNFKSIKKQII